MKTTHTFQSCGHDGPPSFLPCHISWIDIVDVQARSPFAVSGALHSSDGENVEVPSTPRIIPIVVSKTPLSFSSMVQLARCRTIHLALSIFSELGQKSPSLTADLEYSSHPPLPVISSSEDHDKRSYGGSPCHDDCQPPSR
jgi:hypothetical protein